MVDFLGWVSMVLLGVLWMLAFVAGLLWSLGLGSWGGHCSGCVVTLSLWLGFAGAFASGFGVWLGLGNCVARVLLRGHMVPDQ